MTDDYVQITPGEKVALERSISRDGPRVVARACRLAWRLPFFARRSSFNRPDDEFIFYCGLWRIDRCTKFRLFDRSAASFEEGFAREGEHDLP